MSGLWKPTVEKWKARCAMQARRRRSRRLPEQLPRSRTRGWRARRPSGNGSATPRAAGYTHAVHIGRRFLWNAVDALCEVIPICVGFGEADVDMHVSAWVLCLTSRVAQESAYPSPKE